MAAGGESGRPVAVIFDMDGTMVDNRTYHEAAWIELGRKHGLPITPEFYLRKLHSKSNREVLCELFGAEADEELIRRITDQKESIYRELYAPYVREIPGLTELLVALRKAGVSCAVVSNSPHVNVDFILERLHLHDFFRCVLSADDVAKGKPDPELFLTAVERLDASPDRCVVLEDSASGFLAAERAGISYAIITAGAEPEQVLRFQNKACAVYHDFTEVRSAWRSDGTLLSE